ncbi:radical SAM protein [Candidatus Kuenenbacteria bacterium]|nr:radical SAM protein [Candidatus Kuenenbacteria bacterium]
MADKKIKIAWFGRHFGEEPPLIGSREEGAGGIFFAGCNLRCVFCQNYQISQQSLGRYYSISELADIMLRLEAEGAVNIDLVTPTIWAEPIIAAIPLARRQGLKIPIVWNSNAYETVDLIKSLRGLVDIFLPDFKYSDDRLAYKYSQVKNYSTTAAYAIAAMLENVGHPRFDRFGLMSAGLVVRHLVLPGNLENSFGVLDSIAQIDQRIFVSLMAQYYPLRHAFSYPELNRRLSKKEFDTVQNYQLQLGLENGWYQELTSAKMLIPDFTKPEPFGMI